MQRPPQYLSFSTPHTGDPTVRGDQIRSQLAARFEEQGFAVDLEVGQHDPDWYFRVTDGGSTAGIALVISERPDLYNWSIGLENTEYRNLESDELRERINPILLSAVEGIPSVSNVRWHHDSITLKELACPTFSKRSVTK